MMKKWMAILAAAGCLLALSGCGQQKPSLDEVEQTINEGNITVEDALDKGWITQEWADQYIASNTVDAADKTVSFGIGDFKTQTAAGEEFTREDLNPVTFWAFIDPSDSEAESWYQALTESYQEIEDKGAEVLVCTKDDEDFSMFEDAPFTVIVYNDSVEEALSNNGMSEMVEELPNTGNWFVGEYFASSWYSKLTAEDLIEAADGFIGLYQERQNDASSQDTSDDTSDSMSAVAMG